MRTVALRQFSYSDDGLRTRQIRAGDEFDCRPDLFPGLSKGGFVRLEKAVDDGALETGSPVPLPAPLAVVMTAVHRGAGKYGISADGKFVPSPVLNKEQAAEFNAADVGQRPAMLAAMQEHG